jgi:hypothetical protein
MEGLVLEPKEELVCQVQLQTYKKFILKQLVLISKRIASLKNLKITGKPTKYSNSKINSSKTLKDFREVVQLQVKV